MFGYFFVVISLRILFRYFFLTIRQLCDGKEGHGINITVNNIGISGLDTGMLKQIVGDNPDIILDIIPHKNLASIDSIIEIIEFFCSENSSDIGSQTVYLGGIS